MVDGKEVSVATLAQSKAEEKERVVERVVEKVVVERVDMSEERVREMEAKVCVCMWESG